jgi:hypothetical protein
VDADRVRAKVRRVERTWLTPGEAEHLDEIRREQRSVLAAELDYKPQTAEQLSEAVTLPVALVEKRLREEPERFEYTAGVWRLR